MTDPLAPAEIGKRACALAAARLVEPGMTVGLGTGSTANYLVRELGRLGREEGLRFRAVSTSSRTADLATSEGIDVIPLAQAGWLDLTIDGADEFDAALTLIKGGGGAHLQEKIVAAASSEMVVIADASKEVASLGAFPLPVEVTPFGWEVSRALIAKALEGLGYDSQITTRKNGEAAFVTDEGNHLLDLHLGEIKDATALSIALNQIPGVIENGLFIGMCSKVILGHEDGNTSERTL